MEIYNITKKLIGPIHPVGDSGIDEKRLDNLKQTIVLIDSLLDDVTEVAKTHNNGEHSLKLASEYANNYLNKLTL